MQPRPEYLERLRASLPTATATLRLPLRHAGVFVSVAMLALAGLILTGAGLWPLIVGLAARPAPHWGFLIAGIAFAATGLLFWWLFQRGRGLVLTATGIEWFRPLMPPLQVAWSSIDAIEHRTHATRAGVTNRLFLRLRADGGAPARAYNMQCDSWPAPKDVLALVRAWWSHHRGPGGGTEAGAQAMSPR